MIVNVTSHFNDDNIESFSGSEDKVRRALVFAYPFLLRMGSHKTIQDYIDKINSTQAFSASFSDDIQKAESDHSERQYLHAAAFLAGQDTLEEPTREAELANEGDIIATALASYKLEDTKEHRDALKAILSTKLIKSEEKPVDVENVTPLVEDATEFANIIARCAKYNEIKPVELGGKHSEGSMLANDMQGDDATHETILLKPGSGKPSRAAGVSESGASQSNRETAYYAIGKIFGIAKWIPETHLVAVDGKEYAAIEFLPKSFQTLKDLQKEDPAGVPRLLHIYLNDGTLHKWGALDYIAGNVDRHSGNILYRGDEIYLIDHGSTMAGDSFDPANDQYSFIPYYLRAFALSDFHKLTNEEKYKAMPKVSFSVDHELANWLHSIDDEALSNTLIRYGINSKPIMNRLHKLKNAISHGVNASSVIDAAWTIGL